jgi:hypothetical protein
MKIERESPSVSDRSTACNVAIIAIVVFAAHLALLVGVTSPDRFYFDEVHYVPAARQMLEPVMPAPMLDPMHPPLPKQLMAMSIRIFGDVPLDWRYPSVLFGSLAIVAMYLCCSLRGVPRSPPACSSSTRGCSCSRESRCWIFRARVRSVCDRRIHPRLSEAAAASLVRARRARFRSFDRQQMERAVCAGGLHRYRRRDPSDTGWRTQFADGNASPISAAFVGTSMETFVGLMLFLSWI